jgi:twitching motility protein PilI
MADVTSLGPFQRLRRLERLGFQHDATLPEQEEAVALWTGVGFRLAGRHYIAPMRDVTEILTPPELSRVPHARGWVRGIANVRGTLLPVMDLGAYLGKSRINPSRLARVLVIGMQGSQAGLLVDEVLGLRHFEAESRRAGHTEPDVAIAEYIDGAFVADGLTWPVFSMNRLARHPQFMAVAE